jgi:hypothetical protein
MLQVQLLMYGRELSISKSSDFDFNFSVVGMEENNKTAGVLLPRNILMYTYYSNLLSKLNHVQSNMFVCVCKGTTKALPSSLEMDGCQS